jgi:predicted AlkP superfamily phosphohydrolase/phosphomutase
MGGGVRTGALTGLLAGVVTTLALAGLAPAFLDPALPAVATLLVAHAVAGAVLGGIVGLILGGSARGATRGAIVLAYAVLVAGVAWLAGPRGATPTASTAPGPRVVVVGLDGGSWRVLDPLLAAGQLPTLARFVGEGTSGVLTSIEPTFSPVVWTSIATGKVAAKHGIHSFYSLQNVDLHAGRFWEVVAKRGEPIGMFQWLITWPPDALPGFIIPAWLARDARTTPPELTFLKQLEMSFQQHHPLSTRQTGEIGVRLVRHGLRFATAARAGREMAGAVMDGDSRSRYRAGKLAQLDINGDVFLSLYRQWHPRLAAMVVYASDALSHSYWRYHEPQAFPDVKPDEVAKYGDTIRECYRRFDALLARVLATVGDDTNVVVVSDHGFQPAEDHLRTVSAEGLLAAVGEMEHFHGQAINQEAYLLHRTPEAPEVKADVERTAAKLRALRHDGKPLIDVEITQPHALTARLLDTPLDMKGTVETESGSKPLESVVTVTAWSGSHELAGIILARGPLIRRGVRLESASLLDVAPTVLHMLGLPVAADMDGHVLTDMLATQTPIQTVATIDDDMPKRTVEAAAPEEDVTDRLRALGYVR